MNDATMTIDLTADDLKAIRKCDRIVFNHGDTSAAWAAKNNPKHGDPFEPWDFRHDLPCADAVVTNFTGSYGSARVEPTSFTGSVERDDLVVLRALLRKGDALQAHWRIGNNNDHVRDAGLRADDFSVRILRGNKCIEVTVCTVVRRAHDRYVHC